MSKVSEAMIEAGMREAILAATFPALDPDFSPPVEQGEVERAARALLDFIGKETRVYASDEPMRNLVAALRNSPPTEGETK